jgi:hypothetical protein
MKRLLILLSSLALLVTTSSVKGQDTEKTLQNLFGKLITGDSDAERAGANDSILLYIRNYVKSDSIFKHNFNIRNMGQITSSDSTLKIVSWNLLLENFKGTYFTYLIKKSTKGI